MGGGWCYSLSLVDYLGMVKKKVVPGGRGLEPAAVVQSHQCNGKH
jgi:hypothetical protein